MAKENQLKKPYCLRYTLSKISLIFIIIYFILLLVAGIVGAVIIIINLNRFLSKNFLATTMVCSFSVAACFSSIQYIRRIYKACIDNRIDFPTDNSNEVKNRHIGNIIYFIFRPIFAIAFVIIAVLCLFGGFIFVISSIDYIINDKFFYLSVILSSIIGFSIGRIIDLFDAFAWKKINNVLNKAYTEDKEDDSEKER